MIQDIGAHQFNNAYLPAEPDGDSIVLYYDKRTALVKKTDGEIMFPRFRELEADHPEIYTHAVYLFRIDEQRFYLVNEPLNIPDGFEMISIGEFRGGKPRYLAFAGITGYQLFTWYDSNRFCGRCGTKMHHDKKERMMRCDACGQMEYPKLSPAVIVAVRDGEKLLLTKYAGREFKKYALIAGFCEIGETVEETVHREVMEEVGLKVKNLTYYKSQPWSFSGSLLMGFYCDLEEPDQIRLQEDELATAEWFERGEIPLEDQTNAALTQEMIRRFKEGKDSLS